MSSLPARRLTTACVALVTVATLVYMTVPAARPALWAAIGLSGLSTAVLVGTRVHRPRPSVALVGPGRRTAHLHRGRLHDGRVVARAQGATLRRFLAERLADLRALLAFLALPSELKNRLKTAAAGRGLDHLDGPGVSTLNTDRLPIVEVPLVNPADLDAVAAFLREEGVYVTLAAHPLVPRDRVGFRVQLTALHSDADIDHLDGTLTRLSERFPLRLKG
ncbi:hypothetical protein [Streptomyces sp. NPDC056948]|uniref:hypothetical protein n=1 Tax=Streptomyces sp. NPDC056948 TaxID=3345975 RepID=UPI00363B12BE